MDARKYVRNTFVSLRSFRNGDAVQVRVEDFRKLICLEGQFYRLSDTRQITSR